MASGYVTKIGDDLHIVEGYLDGDDDKVDSSKLAAFVRRPLSTECVKRTIDVHSGAIAFFPSEFAFTGAKVNAALDSVRTKGGTATCEMDAGSGVVVTLPNGRYEILLEPHPGEPDAQRAIVRRAK